MTSQQEAVLGPEHAVFRGLRGTRLLAPDPVDASSVRRFAQAIMDDDPMYWDADVAAASRFGGVVAPPMYPLHALRRRAGTPDPLDAAVDPEFDGAGDLLESLGLPRLDLPLKRLLNGGNEVEVFSLARLGETIAATSVYEDVYEKHGRSGPLVFVTVLTDYQAVLPDGSERRLLTSRQTFIWR